MNYVYVCGWKRDVSLWNPRQTALFLRIASSVKHSRWFNLRIAKQQLDTELGIFHIRKSCFWKMQDTVVSNQMKSIVGCDWVTDRLQKRCQRPSAILCLKSLNQKLLAPISPFTCVKLVKEGRVIFKKWLHK